MNNLPLLLNNFLHLVCLVLVWQSLTTDSVQHALFTEPLCLLSVPSSVQQSLSVVHTPHPVFDHIFLLAHILVGNPTLSKHT